MSPAQAQHTMDGAEEGKLSSMESNLESRFIQDDSIEGHRDAVRVLFRVINMLAVIIFLLTSSFLYLIRNGHVEDRYFAMAFDGKKMQMQSIADMSLNTNAMLSWASEAATQVMTFGFNDINERFAAARPYFTEVGWFSFNEALKKSNLLYNMMQNQQLMTAIPAGVPVVAFQGVRDGGYTRDVIVPLVLTLRAGNSAASAHPELTLTIVNVPTRDNPAGIGIEKWTMY